MTSNVQIVGTNDGTTFMEPATMTGPNSNYGLQMANYRGELYGVMVNEDGGLGTTKLKAGTGWRDFRAMPALYKSAGRVAVTVLDDRYYVAYRGTNNGVYLVWTENFEDWNDAGRIGSVYAKSVAAPGLAAYGGKLYLTGVGPDAYIYYTICDMNGLRGKSWTKIDGTGTQSALTMAVYDGSLYLFHAGYNNGAFYYQTLKDTTMTKSEPEWSALTKQATSSLSSGLSAVSWKFNQLAVTYKGREDVIVKYFDGKTWTKGAAIPSSAMKYQTGLATWAGILTISYAAADSSSSYRKPRAMCEKSAYRVHEDEVDEWDCKWQQEEPKKSLVKKFFCM